MLNALNTKILLIIVALLASIASYLAYEKHQQVVAQKKYDQMFEEMRQPKKQPKPQQWGDSLKKH